MHRCCVPIADDARHIWFDERALYWRVPFLGQRAVHALDLAVLPGARRPSCPGALGLERRVRTLRCGACYARPARPMPSKKRRHRPMNAAQVPLRSSGGSSASTLLKSSTATCRQAAPALRAGAAAAPQGMMAAAVRYGATFLIDVLVSPARSARGDRAAALPTRINMETILAHVRAGTPVVAASERGRQHPRGAGLAPLLPGRREPRQPSRAAASVGEPSPDLCWFGTFAAGHLARPLR